MKRFIIISADVAMNKLGKEARVVFTAEHKGSIYPINRSCNQALHDMQKSGRATSFPADLFVNGADNVPFETLNRFRKEIISLGNKTATGDVSFYEAGEEYEATEGNSAVVSGEAQVGDILTTKKAGARVEGFLNIPIEDKERFAEMLIVNNPALAFEAFFGIKVGAPVKEVVEEKSFINEKTEEEQEREREEQRIKDLQNSAFGATPEEEHEQTPTKPAKKAEKAK